MRSGYHIPMHLRRTIAIALLVAMPLRASELPDLGESARTAFSEAQEDQLGREIMRQIRANRDYLDDAEISDYLNGLGDRLAASSANPRRRFEFFVVRDPTINAFALPGGYIGVHTGLLSAVRNESELAGVLSHEIAHVTQNHLARMVDAQRSSTLLSLAALAVAILAARSDSQISQAAATMAGALNVQSQLDFSRDNEREADRAGLQTLTDAGFAASGMASFFQRLQEQSRLLETSAPAYLRTHPLTYQRIADMQNRVSELPYKQHADSLEFSLVRARVWAEEGEPITALQRFELMVKADARDVTAWYGLTRAALRAGRPERARAALAGLESLGPASPMVDSLAAEVLLALGQPERAVARLADAQHHYSSSRPLAYAYARALLAANQPARAIGYLEEQMRTWPDEPALYSLKAQAHTALGQRLDAHLAQAESYARQGAVGAAIEQLRLAIASGEKDFYKLSIAEARLRQLKDLQQREKPAP